MNQIEHKILALREARVMIVSDQHRFICTALRDVGFSSKNWKTRKACTELTAYIDKALGMYPTLDMWLRDNGYSATQLFAHHARLQWIEWMIAMLLEDLDHKLHQDARL